MSDGSKSHWNLKIKCMKCGIIMKHQVESVVVDDKWGTQYDCQKCKHKIVVFDTRIF